jgi:hypothetical protein
MELPRRGIMRHKYIITRTVAFQTQDVCWYSWIMDQGLLKGIHLFSTIFCQGFFTNNTTLMKKGERSHARARMSGRKSLG